MNNDVITFSELIKILSLTIGGGMFLAFIMGIAYYYFEEE